MRERSDTIAALATAPGRGGVGIIRVSGPEAKRVAKEILQKSVKPKKAMLGAFYDAEGNKIDKGVALYFMGPNSFTGEDVLELQGHGGPVIMDLLLERVLGLGVRHANPGEFTQRAFLNGKLDLVQAEAVADLIGASTSQAAKNALRSLEGEFSKQINRVVDQLISLRAWIEATIDFVEEEDVKEIELEKAGKELEKTFFELKEIKSKAEQGLIIKEGVNLVIAGKPNAGKSSLLNCLSGQERAIVTNVPGTTRDLLQAQIQIKGLPVNVLDTAGLNENPGVIEQEGIKRAWVEIKKADHILFVVDASASQERDGEKLATEVLREKSPHSKLTVLYNKIDLTGEQSGVYKDKTFCSIYASTKDGSGLDLLRLYLKESAIDVSVEGGFSARRRHLDALKKTGSLLEAVMERLSKQDYLETIAEDLRLAQNVLGEITGRVVVDDLLDKIFSEFCVGK